MVSSSRFGWSEIVRAALVVTIAVVPFLFPRLPPESAARFCGNLIEVRGPIKVFLNCDSVEFLRLAKNPALIVTPDHRTRQSRPLYGALGWVFASPLRALGVQGRSGRLSGEYLSEYGGLILLNWLLLVASIVILRRLLDAQSYLESRMLLPVAILLVNEVTKAFFWTPHVQLFNIFIPVASLALLRWMQPRVTTLTWRRVSAIGLLIGLGNLVYGGFAVMAAAAMLCILLGDGLRTFRLEAVSRLLSAAILAVAFITPFVTWMAFVVAQTGGFYSHEVDYYRQFVWLANSASEGASRLLADLARNLAAYLKTLATVALFPALMLAAVLLLIVAARQRPAAGDRASSRAVIWYLAANVGFFTLMGYYPTRLTWSAVPPIILLLGHAFARLERSTPQRARLALRAGMAGVALCYATYWFARVGPYS